jgi:hypothetical protein
VPSAPVSALLAGLLLLGVACSARTNPHFEALCPWRESLVTDSGAVLVVRETAPSLALSLDGSAGKKWALAASPVCTGLLRSGENVVCWQAGYDNRSLSAPFEVLVAKRPYYAWSAVPTGESRRPRALFGRYLVFAQGEVNPAAALDVAKILPGSALGPDALEQYPSVAAAEAAIAARLFPGLPPSARALVRDDRDCWAAEEPNLLHATCELADWKVVTRLESPFDGVARGLVKFTTVLGALYLVARVGRTEDGQFRAKAALVHADGRFETGDGPPSPVLQLSSDERGDLWAVTSEGVFARASGQREWARKLQSQPCGADYQAAIQIY